VVLRVGMENMNTTRKGSDGTFIFCLHAQSRIFSCLGAKGTVVFCGGLRCLRRVLRRPSCAGTECSAQRRDGQASCCAFVCGGGLAWQPSPVHARPPKDGVELCAA